MQSWFQGWNCCVSEPLHGCRIATASSCAFAGFRREGGREEGREGLGEGGREGGREGGKLRGIEEGRKGGREVERDRGRGGQCRPGT